MRKEILEAIEKKKTIIPVLCDGFDWPRDKYKDMPDEICILENYNAVKSTQAYLNAMIDRLISFMSNIDNKGIISGTMKESAELVSTEEYFGKALENVKNVESVDMAFHGGAEWFTSIEKTDLLHDLVDAGVHIRVLLNPSEVSEGIARHMRHKRKTYMGFDECIARWKEFVSDHSESVEFRLVDIPLLRRYYSLHMKDPKQDTVNVKYYTYANSRPDKNYQPIFHRGSDYFNLYRDEFEYLWNKETDQLNLSTEEYFAYAYKRVGAVSEINMFFRAGSEWHHKAKLVDILLNAIEKKIPVHVLVNDAETVEQLSVHMRQPLKKYYGYSNSRQDWLEKAQLYPDCIKVRIADIPLMHRYYCIKGKKGKTARVSFYTYGNYIPEKDFQHIFDQGHQEYVLYEEEFEYIWNKASHEGTIEL